MDQKKIKSVKIPARSDYAHVSSGHVAYNMTVTLEPWNKQDFNSKNVVAMTTVPAHIVHPLTRSLNIERESRAETQRQRHPWIFKGYMVIATHRVKTWKGVDTSVKL